jgi:putative ABC transport system permease protein
MTAWIAPGVADRLGVRPGDRLQIGAATLVIGGVIAAEPDRLSEGFALGPAMIVSEEALAAFPNAADLTAQAQAAALSQV